MFALNLDTLGLIVYKIIMIYNIHISSKVNNILMLATVNVQVKHSSHVGFEFQTPIQ